MELSNKDQAAEQTQESQMRTSQVDAVPPKKTGGKKKKKKVKAAEVVVEVKPPRIVFNVFNTQYDVIKEVGRREYNWKLSNKDPWYTQIEWDIIWADVAPNLERWKEMKPFQKINHFPGMYQIARKNYLARNLNKMQKQFPADYKFFPKTWLLPHQLEDLKNYANNNPSQTFIVKPEALSQGKGIFITKRFDGIDPAEHLVVQKYVNKPYLIDDYKFDFRVYVLVTNVQPLRIFMFKNGLARFASEKYKQKAFNNPFIHLTNYAINKDNANYKTDTTAEATTGHKRSLNSIWVKLARDGLDVEKIKGEMRDMIIKTLISVQPDLIHHYRTSQPSDIYNNMCFEILGFDVLIDKAGTPWLLEVNHAPSFNCDTALDASVKRNLLLDTFRLLNVTLEEKQHIIALIQKIHEQRVIGINKTSKQSYYQQRYEMQQSKLNENDDYQLQNLGDYERLYPPMKLYEKTFVPEVEEETPAPTDPLALKFWLHDQQMKKKKLEQEKLEKANKKREIKGIEGNTIDTKLHHYYEEFQQVAKSFVNNIQVSKIQKPIAKKASVAKLPPKKPAAVKNTLPIEKGILSERASLDSCHVENPQMGDDYYENIILVNDALSDKSDEDVTMESPFHGNHPVQFLNPVTQVVKTDNSRISTNGNGQIGINGLIVMQKMKPKESKDFQNNAIAFKNKGISPQTSPLHNHTIEFGKIPWFSSADQKSNNPDSRRQSNFSDITFIKNGQQYKNHFQPTSQREILGQHASVGNSIISEKMRLSSHQMRKSIKISSSEQKIFEGQHLPQINMGRNITDNSTMRYNPQRIIQAQHNLNKKSEIAPKETYFPVMQVNTPGVTPGAAPKQVKSPSKYHMASQQIGYSSMKKRGLDGDLFIQGISSNSVNNANSVKKPVRIPKDKIIFKPVVFEMGVPSKEEFKSHHF